MAGWKTVGAGIQGSHPIYSQETDAAAQDPSQGMVLPTVGRCFHFD